MRKKILIVGGVAGGASAAARLRRNDENTEIIMFERGQYISFANCGLPYYIGNTITERSNLLVQTPEDMKKRFNIDVRVMNEIINIDRQNKEVEVKDYTNNIIYKESYDKLILSPGSSPLRPPIPGIDAPNIFTIWNIPDTDAIKTYVDSGKVKKAAVIGGGFIGIEMAENLYDLGFDVSIIELADQVMAPLDYEMAQIVHRHINSKGLKLHLKDGVKSFRYNDGVTTIELNSGSEVDADIVILAIGVRPNGEIAKKAGLKVNERGGIVVDDYLRTSDEHIYAVGDAIEVVDYINDGKTMIPLAGPANKQGRIAADNICGDNIKYKGTQGTSVAKVFDLTVSSTGSNEKVLKKLGKEYGKDYLTVFAHPKNHAGYYPGACQLNMKLVFDSKDGRIIGTQVVGLDGVEKRVDVIASAIRFGGTIYDLVELELAYAPPYGSAKDPVNMVGFAAENILKGKMNIIQWHELETLDMSKYTILDVREEIEIDLGFIPNSVNIPVDDLRDRLNELDKNKTIIVYCAVGLRAYIAARILMQNGFKNVKNLSGGWTTYNLAFYKINSCLTKDNNNTCCQANCDIDDRGEVQTKIQNKNAKIYKVNACGLQCPGPIMQVYESMKAMNEGDILEITATDMGFASDIAAWCQRTGNTFVKSESKGKEFFVQIMKGTKEVQDNRVQDLINNGDKSMVVFSGDLDKALAAFIIANGGATMGRKVTMFFTFWGLNILRKHEKINVKKSIIEKMFGMMMPRGSKKLKLSKMNMAGMGSVMMKKVMKDKNVTSLEELINQAQKNGVNIVACTMSMDVMGIKKEELIDGIEYAGVASYLAAAETSDVNLFI